MSKLFSCRMFVLVICFLCNGCSEFVEVRMPDGQVTLKTVFEDDRTAQSAMNGLYIEIAQKPVLTNGAIAILSGLSSDELQTSQATYLNFAENQLTSENDLLLSSLWKPAYRYIYLSNLILEGLDNSSELVSFEVKQQLEGEARFIRANCYFHLINLFGNVPLVISTDLERNDAIERSNSEEIYDLVESDLSIAADLLPDKFSTTDEGEGRIRISSWAATALHAKVSLYRGKWALAETLASQVIDNSSNLFQLEEQLSRVFSNRSKEAIWQIQAVFPGKGTWEASTFIPDNGMPPFLISNESLNAFESGDARRHTWIDSVDDGNGGSYYFPRKYNFPYSQEEYHTEIRLADIILVRAEALAKLNDVIGSLKDIDLIRARAGLPLIESSDIDEQTLFEIIRQERRAEFIAEGSRWYDLKRWEIAGNVLSIIANKVWRDTDTLYPVPKSEIEHNQNLLPQNDGY